MNIGKIEVSETTVAAEHDDHDVREIGRADIPDNRIGRWAMTPINSITKDVRE